MPPPLPKEHSPRSAKAEGELAETPRLDTTLLSLNLYCKRLGEGGGQALEETLRLAPPHHPYVAQPRLE
jgi:hypothetical protein